MVLTAVFTAILCAVAPFSVTIGPIPLTFATLVIYLAAGSLGWRFGALTVALYVVLGAIGLPVFSNFEGGFHKIVGVTGGYIIGYIPCAMATGIIVELSRKKNRNGIGGSKYLRAMADAFGMVIGTILLYTCGTAWFMLQTGNTLAYSLALCVTPFLIGDTVKIILACMAAPQLRNALHVLRTR